MGSLQGLLAEPVSAEAESQIHELLLRKVVAMAGAYVEAVRALEAAGGAEAVETLRQRRLRQSVEDAAERGRRCDNSLRAYCAALERGCRGSHEWVKTADSDTEQGYRFTRCVWAEAFRAINAADIGCWICQGDGPVAAAFNPAIRLRLTKTLMAGDDCCDHVFYTAEG